MAELRAQLDAPLLESIEEHEVLLETFVLGEGREDRAASLEARGEAFPPRCAVRG
jgi:hypothetical protein